MNRNSPSFLSSYPRSDEYAHNFDSAHNHYHHRPRPYSYSQNRSHQQQYRHHHPLRPWNYNTSNHSSWRFVSHSSDPYEPLDPIYADGRTMHQSLLAAVNMDATNTSNSSSDHHNYSQPQVMASPPRGILRNVHYETTHDGDVVVVQPSFEETVESKVDHRDWSKEGPNGQDFKQGGDEEHRNPSPLCRSKNAGHTRNLSAHFYDATTLTDDREADQNALPMVKEEDDNDRKHRRIFSGDVTNPNAVAHRRLDSTGASRPVRRNFRGPNAHHRVDSQGLDILSAAVDATKDELAAAVGDRSYTTSWEPSVQTTESRPSIGQVSTGSYEQPTSNVQHNMQPPSQNPRVSQQSSMSSYLQPPHAAAYMAAHPHSAPYPPTTVHYQHPPPVFYYGPPPPYHGPHPGQGYPVQSGRTPLDGQIPEDKGVGRGAEQQSKPNHQGSQTFVTAIAVGDGTKTIQPSVRPGKNVGTSTDDINIGLSTVPSHVGHHRKMSSFSSIGTLLGSSLFSPGDDKPGHHRHTSSTVSFLNALDVGFESTNMNDDFLRAVQASNNGEYTASQQAAAAAAAPPPALSNQKARASPQASKLGARPSSVTSDGSSQSPSYNDEEVEVDGTTKLASGGTSKRVRRKCTIEGCQNRVVQGGLCISHGAKRKTCKHPGCNKNVKKAGLCSTHGPARKRCDHEGCSKVAVQGGRCIAHGAKKKLCSVEGCAKQAILAGMCKKHHDQNNAVSKGDNKDMKFCQPIGTTAAPTGKKPTHTRGLSIFQEMSADTVSTLLNNEF